MAPIYHDTQNYAKRHASICRAPYQREPFPTTGFVSSTGAMVDIDLSEEDLKATIQLKQLIVWIWAFGVQGFGFGSSDSGLRVQS